MEKHKTFKSAEIASEWWANELKNPSVQDCGEDLQSMLLTIVKSNIRTSEQKIENFQNALKSALNERLNSIGEENLCVDYGPMNLLAEVAKDSNINPTPLPCKTLMVVTKTDVKVKKGYYGVMEEIYSENKAKPKLIPRQK